MHFKRALPLVLLALAGCATSEKNIYGGPIGQGVTGNAVSVIISNVWNEMDAFQLAEKHCQTYNKSARLNNFQNYKASFDCI
jgi:hypothetical protein